MSVALVCCGVQFPDSTVQCTAFTGGGVQYVCGIACSSISAGDPVSLICQETGAVSTTLGYQTTQNLSGGTNNYAALKFSDSCFVTMVMSGCGGLYFNPGRSGYTYCGNYYPPISAGCSYSYNYICIRAHTVNNLGIVTSTTCISCTCNCCVTSHSPIVSVLGCSGTTGAFLTYFYTPCGCCSYNCGIYCGPTTLLETFLCYCTATCTVSLIRQCAGTLPGCIASCVPKTMYFPYKTPDGKYLMTFMLSTCCAAACYLECNFCNFPCCAFCLSLSVKATTDSVCYLGTSYAASCNIPLNSILPSAAVFFSGYACNSYCDASGCGTGYKKGFAPFSYGPDGWLLMHFDVGLCCPGACQILCACQKFWGIKPIADQCYAMTCNFIDPVSTPNVYYSTNFSNRGGACYPTGCNNVADGGYIWDQGDCIKRQLIQYTFACNCAQTPCCAVCMAIQCFCIGAGPCIYFLGYTFCQRASNTYATNFSYSPCSPYQCCCAAYTGGYYAPITNCNSVRTWALGAAYFLNGLYLASIPYCYQCGCYYFATTDYAAAGVETSCGCCSAFTNGQMSGSSNSACQGPLFVSQVGLVRGAFNSSNLCCWAVGSPCSVFRVDCCFLIPPASPNSGVCVNTFLMKNNSLALSYNNILPSCAQTPFSYQIATFQNTTTPTLFTAISGTATINQFIGIAQNTVSVGGTVCYAVAGMLDTSPWAQRIACFINCNCYSTCCVASSIYCPFGPNPTVPGTSCPSGSLIAGWYTPINFCVQNGIFFYRCDYSPAQTSVCAWVMCPASPYLFNGTQCDCFRFTYYGSDNLRFIPHYDVGLGKWTSTFHTHCRNIWCQCTNQCYCCNCCPAAGCMAQNGIPYLGACSFNN